MACAECVAIPVVAVPIPGDLAVAFVNESEQAAIAIHYDGEWMDTVLRRYGYAAAVGVFGHEFGHVLALGGSELEADRWAGCTLATLGLDAYPFSALLLAFTGLDAEARVDAVAAGVGECASR